MRNPFQGKPNFYKINQAYEELAYAHETCDANEDAIDLLITEIEEPKLVRMFERIKERLNLGDSLGSSVTDVTMEQTDFPKHLIDTSDSDNLASIFQVLSILKVRENTFNIFTFKSVSYPFFLLATLVFLLYMVNVFIIPEFRDLFESFGSDLPALTAFFFSISELAIWVWIGPLLFLVLLIPAFGKNKKVVSLIDQAGLRIPYYGNRFKALHLNELLNRIYLLRDVTGLGDQKILQLACEGITNSILREGILATEFSGSLFGWLKDSPDIPFRVKRITSRSKDENEIWSDLEHYLDYQTRRLNEQISNSLSNLVVFLSVSIYLLAGLIIISLYLPIFKLGSVV